MALPKRDRLVQVCFHNSKSFAERDLLKLTQSVQGYVNMAIDCSNLLKHLISFVLTDLYIKPMFSLMSYLRPRARISTVFPNHCPLASLDNIVLFYSQI